MTSGRQNLAAVLGVVGDTYWWADASSWAVYLRDKVPPMDEAGITLRAAGFERVAPWRHDTPAAALEALAAATPALVPGHWTDAVRAPRWWCEACEGTGEVRGVAGGFATVWWCGVCDPRGAAGARPGVRRDPSSPVGTADAPPSLPSLVSVAALGVDVLARVDSIAAEGWPGQRVAWRALPRVAYGMARVQLLLVRDDDRCRAASGALWDLGVYPLDLGGGRVVLGVEGVADGVPPGGRAGRVKESGGPP